MQDNQMLIDYIKEGREWRQEVTKHMATTSLHIENFKDYVKECDEDRKEQAKRLTAIETDMTASKRVIAAGFAALSSVGVFLEFFRK